MCKVGHGVCGRRLVTSSAASSLQRRKARLRYSTAQTSLNIFHKKTHGGLEVHLYILTVSGSFRPQPLSFLRQIYWYNQNNRLGRTKN